MLVRAALLICVAALPIRGQSSQTATLVDDFTRDSYLNSGIWQINTPAVMGLANDFVPGAQLDVVPLRLTFSASGMSVSGVSTRRQFAGIQSRQAFVAPLSVRATVMGVSAFANPFALMLVSRETGRFLNVFGNLNPGNVPAYKLAVNGTGFTAQVLDPRPTVNRWYTLEISVDAAGKATVSVGDESGSVYNRVSDLEFCTDPSYIVLSQNEFSPRQQGPNLAIWRNIVAQGEEGPAPARVPVESQAPTAARSASPSPSPDPWIEPSVAATNGAGAPRAAPPSPLPAVDESGLAPSSARINLTGAWMSTTIPKTAANFEMWIEQRGEDVTISLTRDLPITPPSFRGKYISNPVIHGIGLDSHGGTSHWAERRLIVKTPDRLLSFDPAHPDDGATLYVRINAYDITCSDDAKQYAEPATAFQYGSRAISRKDYRTALCWFTYGADQDDVKSQLYLITLLDPGNAVSGDPAYNIHPDPDKAFYWAERTAREGIVAGELALASFYRNATGTLPNPIKADYWDRRAKEQQWVDEAGTSLSDNLSDYFQGDISSIESDIARYSNCPSGERARCESRVRALQNDLERARERNADIAGELQSTASRLKQDCADRFRAACEVFESVNRRIKRLGGTPIQ